MKITYRERRFIDRYTCVDTEKTFHATDYFIPEKTSLYYFKVNEFDYKTVAKEDIIRIEQA